MNKTSTAMTATRAMVLGVLLTTGFMVQPALADEKEVTITIPDTSAAIWQAIDNEADTLSKMIQTGAIKDIHHHAFAVRDLVAALPAHSTSLPSDKLAKVKSDGKFVSTLADRLDAAGDGNDKAAAESNFGKLKNVLNALRANYPDIKSSMP